MLARMDNPRQTLEEQIEQLLRPSDVARRLGLSAVRVWQLSEYGKLPIACRTPLGRLFRASDVEAFVKARTERQRRGSRATPSEATD